jgi:hypothetical protein
MSEPDGHQWGENAVREAVRNEAVRKYLNGLCNRLADDD